MDLMWNGILLRQLHALPNNRVGCTDAKTAKLLRQMSPADRAALNDLVRRGPQDELEDEGS